MEFTNIEISIHAPTDPRAKHILKQRIQVFVDPSDWENNPKVLVSAESVNKLVTQNKEASLRIEVLENLLATNRAAYLKDVTFLRTHIETLKQIAHSSGIKHFPTEEAILQRLRSAMEANQVFFYDPVDLFPDEETREAMKRFFAVAHRRLIEENEMLHNLLASFGLTAEEFSAKDKSPEEFLLARIGVLLRSSKISEILDGFVHISSSNEDRVRSWLLSRRVPRVNSSAQAPLVPPSLAVTPAAVAATIRAPAAASLVLKLLGVSRFPNFRRDPQEVVNFPPQSSGASSVSVASSSTPAAASSTAVGPAASSTAAAASAVAAGAMAPAAVAPAPRPAPSGLLLGTASSPSLVKAARESRAPQASEPSGVSQAVRAEKPAAEFAVEPAIPTPPRNPESLHRQEVRKDVLSPSKTAVASPVEEAATSSVASLEKSEEPAMKMTFTEAPSGRSEEKKRASNKQLVEGGSVRAMQQSESPLAEACLSTATAPKTERDRHAEETPRQAVKSVLLELLVETDTHAILQKRREPRLEIVTTPGTMVEGRANKTLKKDEDTPAEARHLIMSGSQDERQGSQEEYGQEQGQGFHLSRFAMETADTVFGNTGGLAGFRSTGGSSFFWASDEDPRGERRRSGEPAGELYVGGRPVVQEVRAGKLRGHGRTRREIALPRRTGTPLLTVISKCKTPEDVARRIRRR